MIGISYKPVRIDKKTNQVIRDLCDAARAVEKKCPYCGSTNTEQTPASQTFCYDCSSLS